VTFQVIFDGSNQFRDVVETASANALIGNLSKPPLDQIQPRTRRRDEVDVDSGMSSHPGFDPRVFVGCVIVHDKMQIEIRRCLGVDLVEKTNEFLVSMARHAVADHFAIEHAQRGEQCGGAVALVVVRHGPAAPLLDRQSWLGTIEGLNLAFLVDAQHQGFVWRVEIKADHIIELFDKTLVAAELESLGQMRLEPMSIPNTLNRHPTDALRLGHGADAPVSGTSGARVQSGLHDCPHFFLGDTWDTTWPRGIFLQSFQTKGKKSFPPELDCRSGNFQPLRDVLAWDSLGRHRDDLRTLNQSQRQASSASPCAQYGPFFIGQQDGRRYSHVTNITIVKDISQANYGTLH
jgi:hypothetical protein